MPKRDPSEKTKSEILKMAVQLFQEKGWANVNIEEIVKKVGVTRGAFYHYFKSREELVYAVIIQMFLDNNPYTIALKKKGLNGLEKLRFAIKLNLKMQSDPLLDKDLEKALDDPIIFKNHFLLIINKCAGFIEKIILNGNEDGSMSVTYPKQTAQIMLILSNTWLGLDLSEVSYEEYIEKVNFMDCLLKSLGVSVIDDELKEKFLSFHEDHKKNKGK